MNKLLIATLSVGTLTVSMAQAADLGVRRAAPAAVMAAPSCAQFGGLYVGVQAGSVFYEHHRSDRNAWAGDVDDDLAGDRQNSKWGFAGGATGGWNWQARCTVFGIEADVSWSGVKASATYFDDTATGGDTLSISSKLQAFGTVRTRGGVVVDNLLLYVTGGLAIANFRRTSSLSDDDGETLVTETLSSKKTRLGWTAGVGTEWAWGNNWSIKSEFLYMQFAQNNESFFSPMLGRTVTFANQDSVWVSRIGLNYRWGGGPVVARY